MWMLSDLLEIFRIPRHSQGKLLFPEDFQYIFSAQTKHNYPDLVKKSYFGLLFGEILLGVHILYINPGTI